MFEKLAKQSSSSSLPLFCCGLIACFISGCSNNISVTPELANETRGPIAVDAGIVLVDRSGYLCVPCEQIGVLSSDKVESISSSCDCVAPSLVKFRSPGNKTNTAVLLTYQRDVYSDEDEDMSPMHLGIIIEVKLLGGGSRKFSVNMLQTSRADGTAL